MAKIEIEEARMYAFLENVVANHERFNSDPTNQRLADIASTSVFGVCFLFNLDPRTVPHILESVVKRERDRDFWGMILYDKLIEKGN